MVLNENSLDASAFIVYLGLAYNILTPAKSLSRATYKVKKAAAAAERIFHVIDNETVVKEDPNAKNINSFMDTDKLALNIMGVEGRKNVMKKFDVEKMCQSTFNEYKKLLNL